MKPKSVIEKLGDLWESWGLPVRRPPTGAREHVVHVYIADAVGRVLVGTLSQDGSEFVFRYSAAFRQRSDLPPLGEFPDKDREYRSAKLWSFFDVRVPPVERPDVQEKMRALRIEPADVFRLLGEIGHREVSTPYEFEIAPSAA